MEIFTDGGCSPNPGPGGWGVCIYRNHVCTYERHGHNPKTTNNRMELHAFIHGLQLALDTDPSVKCVLNTDSSYCVQGYNSWLDQWILRGWKRSDGGQVLNDDQWTRVAALRDQLRSRAHFSVKHVRGHTGIQGNVHADRLANKWRTDDHQNAAEALLLLKTGKPPSS